MVYNGWVDITSCYHTDPQQKDFFIFGADLVVVQHIAKQYAQPAKPQLNSYAFRDVLIAV